MNSFLSVKQCKILPTAIFFAVFFMSFYFLCIILNWTILPWFINVQERRVFQNMVGWVVHAEPCAASHVKDTAARRGLWVGLIVPDILKAFINAVF